jgi:group I intron endonuclease
MIKNLINGKIYIGSSKTVEYRCYEHRKNLRKNKHVNSHLQCAWNKYGEENFIFENVEECNETDLLTNEQLLIDKIKSTDRTIGYNICNIVNKPTMTNEVKIKISQALKGNTPWNLGVPHSETTKEKMRQQKLGIKGKDHPRFGKPVSKITRTKIKQGNLLWIKKNGAVRTGKNHTDETKEKMRQRKLGSKLSTATKEKISKSHCGKICSEDTKNKLKNNKQIKAIGQFENDILIKSFISIAEAKRTTNIKQISQCANGKRKKAGGYTWKFI